MPRRFAEGTAARTGDKLAITIDDAVVSAPVVAGPITGGKSSITIGGTDPRKVQTDAEYLVNALRTGPLPAALTVASVEAMPSGARAAAWHLAARAALALAAGVLVAAALALAARFFGGHVARPSLPR